MTEQEWLTCFNPFPMFGQLGDRGSRRQRQLYCLACWEDVRHLLTDQLSTTRALALLGRKPDSNWLDQDIAVDGLYFDEACTEIHDALSYKFWDKVEADDAELWEAVSSGTEATLTSWNTKSVQAGAAFSITAVVLWSDWVPALYGMDRPPTGWTLAARIGANAEAAGPAVASIWRERQQFHADLIREIFANPYRDVFVDTSWLTWNNGLILSLCRAIYDDRAFDRLPVLADALEEAGCEDADLLAHCRGPGPHIRGCWAVDHILGKT